MSNTDWLLLRLPARADEPLTWAAADASGQLLSVPSTDAGGSLHTLTTGRRVALLVPGAEVSHFMVALPAGNEARLLQLAPFALEDQVSQDIDLLHFAVGNRDAATGLVPVAVTARARMTEWLARASELQLLPQALFAESELAPVLPGHITLVVTDEQLLLRRDDGQPLLLPAADPLLAVEMLMGAEADLSTEHLVVYATPEDWERHGASIETLRERMASFKVQLSAGGLLGLYAQGLAHARPVNLLQGAFRPQPSSRPGWRQWRLAAGLALALLLLHGMGSWWELRQLRKSGAALDQSIASVYASIYPGQSPGAQPRRAMEQRLRGLGAQGGVEGELMPMLAALAAARENVPAARLEALTFATGSMQLRLAAPDASTLEQFSQALRAGGYSAQITAGSQRGEEYEGRVEVGVAGS